MSLDSGDQGRTAGSGSNGNQLPSISNGLSGNNNNNGSSITPSNGAGNNGNQVRLPPISFLSPFSGSERGDFSAGGPPTSSNGGSGAPPTFPLAQFRPQQPQENQLPSMSTSTSMSIPTPAVSQPVEVSSSGTSSVGRPDTSIGLPAPLSTGVDHRRQNLSDSPESNQLPSLPGLLQRPQQEQSQQPTPPSTTTAHNHNHHHHHSNQHNHQETVVLKNEPPANGVHAVDPNATQDAPGEQTTLIADETVQPQQAPELQPAKFSKKSFTVDSSDVFSYASKFPRRHIGSVIYQVNPTAKSVHRILDLDETCDEEHTVNCPNEAPKIIELLPACLAKYVNCLVDVRIPAEAVSDNENVIRRKLWGTDVYTDDSDIVAILHHIGILKTSPPFGEIVQDKEELLEHDITPANKGNKNDVAFFCSKEDANDLVVTLLILPQLEKYTGSYRNNYKSRSWSINHNGASIAVYRVAWCKSGEAAVIPVKKQRVSERLEVWTKLSKTETIDPAWVAETKKTKA